MNLLMARAISMIMVFLMIIHSRNACQEQDSESNSAEYASAPPSPSDGEIFEVFGLPALIAGHLNQHQAERIGDVRLSQNKQTFAVPVKIEFGHHFVEVLLKVQYLRPSGMDTWIIDECADLLTAIIMDLPNDDAKFDNALVRPLATVIHDLAEGYCPGLGHDYLMRMIYDLRAAGAPIKAKYASRCFDGIGEFTT